MANLPYVMVVGTLEKMLEKIKTASVPEKFNADFLSSKLSMKGGSARALVPFIKKLNLVNTDGTPTDRYKEFRNPAKSKIAMAKSMKELYSTLFEMNENVHKLDNTKLKGLIVEATGSDPKSNTVQKTVSTFNTLKNLADFESLEENTGFAKQDDTNENTALAIQGSQNTIPTNYGQSINLSYTINLNLPPTKDIEVFNAIFKSLRQHLLQE